MAREGRWNFYALRVDDQPASIYLDLSLADEVQADEYPVMAWLRVEMREPREDGLSSQQEFDALVALEDRVVPLLTAAGRAVYAGRNTSSGCRDFYFYLAQGEAWDEQVEQAMRAASEYRYQSGHRPDPTWSTYHEFLYPDPRTRESMENRDVCAVLEDRGDELRQPRDIDHWAYFPSPDARDEFLRKAAAIGFENRTPNRDDDEEQEWGAQVFRRDVPAYGAIDDICLPLYDLAHECGGRYDGWECEVVIQPS
ncbi:hypothetical protein ASD77_00640 [Pseudoxanthomonas sp. Root65]|uniref:DUF695 domain-containing protein n=1 Tax=Pseudoxanthomonas sp. Root65 TaxID=1736576 RepID=UPI0006F5B3C4|nr:DUF695 domain-containing protein [Pseudoxanthomonas sp. Root65]KRA53243.1 hypothetical protein ASD77_00640 [Pseudoxanthomonas sp. Root65]